jgi:hypothetical protein
MRNEELCLAIRETYRRAMRTHQSNGQAVAACMAVLRRHEPVAADTEARRLIARMISEEPLGSPHPSSTR